jgi:predicted nuclease of predicted toxin-antitoxin system
MKFLVDECLSTRLVRFLAAAGHDAIHVDDHDLAGRPDEEVLAKAVSDSRVLLSADTDFGEILDRSNDPTAVSRSVSGVDDPHPIDLWLMVAFAACRREMSNGTPV